LGEAFPGGVGAIAVGPTISHLGGARADLGAVQDRAWVENRARRGEWIEVLRRGENPFTPEALEPLRRD
jgi:hypothetical protein